MQFNTRPCSCCKKWLDGRLLTGIESSSTSSPIEWWTLRISVYMHEYPSRFSSSFKMPRNNWKNKPPLIRLWSRKSEIKIRESAQRIIRVLTYCPRNRFSLNLCQSVVLRTIAPDNERKDGTAIKLNPLQRNRLYAAVSFHRPIVSSPRISWIQKNGKQWDKIITTKKRLGTTLNAKS